MYHLNIGVALFNRLPKGRGFMFLLRTSVHVVSTINIYIYITQNNFSIDKKDILKKPYA